MPFSSDLAFSLTTCLVNATGSGRQSLMAAEFEERDSAPPRRRELFFQICGTPEVDGVWTSDFKWISKGPNMFTPRSTVESLQASSGDNAVLKYSKLCIFCRCRMMFIATQWLTLAQEFVCRWSSSVL
jgi:hypothetical protein